MDNSAVEEENLMHKMISNDTLDVESQWSKNINNFKKQQLDPTNYDDYVQWQTENKKNFNNFMKLTTSPQNNPYGIGGNPEAMKKLELQKPPRETSTNNPFMNVPISAYNIPQRFSKAAECGEKCKKNYYKSLIQSPSDALWEREASERQFYTMPNSSVPNEQKKFAEWCYGKNFVAKSGSIYSRYGYPYTPDSLVSTGFNTGEPENSGQVNSNFGLPITYPHASPWVNNPNYGYGFGGIPGGIPFHNIPRASPGQKSYPMPLFPSFSQPTFMNNQKSEQIPQF